MLTDEKKEKRANTHRRNLRMRVHLLFHQAARSLGWIMDVSSAPWLKWHFDLRRRDVEIRARRAAAASLHVSGHAGIQASWRRNDDLGTG